MILAFPWNYNIPGGKVKDSAFVVVQFQQNQPIPVAIQFSRPTTGDYLEVPFHLMIMAENFKNLDFRKALIQDIGERYNYDTGELRTLELYLQALDKGLQPH
jgi:hypothetical protein